MPPFCSCSLHFHICFTQIVCLPALRSYPSCSGARAPGLAADMHFKDDVIAFIGPACAFALEPVARLAAYWNTPIITGMGDQVSTFPPTPTPSHPHSTWLSIRCFPLGPLPAGSNHIKHATIKPEFLLIIPHFSISSAAKPPSSEGELTVTSGILGRIHKWKNESTVGNH